MCSSTSVAMRIEPDSACAASRAARFTASPFTEYVRRVGEPVSPVKTRPWDMPARSGSRPARFTASPTAVNSRSVSSPALRGAPPTSKIFPPSTSTSMSRKETSCAAAASCTLRTASSTAAVSTCAPSPARTPSVPSKRMKETATVRCSGSRDGWERYANSCGGSSCETTAGVGSDRGGRGAFGALGRPARRWLEPPRGRMSSGARSAAVASPTSTSPLPAACSSLMTPEAVGPSGATIRWTAGSPASTR